MLNSELVFKVTLRASFRLKSPLSSHACLACSLQGNAHQTGKKMLVMPIYRCKEHDSDSETVKRAMDRLAQWYLDDFHHKSLDFQLQQLRREWGGHARLVFQTGWVQNYIFLFLVANTRWHPRRLRYHISLRTKALCRSGFSAFPGFHGHVVHHVPNCGLAIAGQCFDPDPPPALRRLYDGSDIQSREFKENMWRYNRAFAFTSIEVTEDHSVHSEWLDLLLYSLIDY